jgi:hypothetical protein
MPTTDPTFVRQLHLDRTARLSSARRVRLPSLPTSLFSRKERRQLAVRPATTC